MAWPKGMPRKGHVNKDGTRHAARGEKLRAMVATYTAPVQNGALRPSTAATEAPTRAPAPMGRRRYTVSRVHPTYTLAADVCPSCGFPEADGGYCPECGWSAPFTLLPRDSVRGPRFGN